MITNFKKIRCPHCRKKILATLGTANICPNCHEPVTIELGGVKYRCIDCKHKFRSREPKNLKCPECDSYRIEVGWHWIGRVLEGL